ncbi:BMP and activin membrane-bound inhibitor-like [Scleropages formosus]|uniref:BMP and activin membrane-bound inhibitor homolog n=1 Tax=Scleropages formosus TaxID=113540 RepID=A0A0P7XKM6_SCLFO|nr:BMP and activin membrane-bound inhibitor-like [Scleropages formosus]
MGRHSSLMSIWIQLELCAMAVLLTKGEIRCYCDAPHCVATGYMCKSALGACFTRVLDPHSVNSPLIHGCVDPVDPSASMCTSPGPSVLRCCHEDMCNYRGLHDLAHPRGEHSDVGSRHQSDSSHNLVTKVQELASAKEVWFRAAVIAVPVAGGLILALLVMLALRMLRSENRRLRVHRQHAVAHLHHSFHSTRKGAPLTKLKPIGTPVGTQDSVCLACDGTRPPDLSRDGILSLVQWGVYNHQGKVELV